MLKNKAVVIFTSFQPDLLLKNKAGVNEILTTKILSSLTEHTIMTLLKAKEYIDFDIIISCDSYSKRKINKKIEHTHLTYIPQKGKSFGEKYINSLKQVRELGYKDIVSIGNDSPSLSYNVILEAFEKIQERNCLVIGPAFDGGFYLIGLRTLDDRIFTDINWQTSKVFKVLLKNIVSENIEYSLLPKLHDIDDRQSLNKWLISKSNLAKLIQTILLTYLSYNTVLIFFPIHEQTAFAKRISQKSPPF
jgi:uncharacterized protein